MRVIDNERVRLAYLEAMGLQQWVPRPATSEKGGSTTSARSEAGTDAPEDDVVQGPDSPTALQTAQNRTPEPDPAPQVPGWSVTGTPQPWLWVLAEGDQADDPLLGKIQQACKVRPPAYMASAGGEVTVGKALEGVETIVVFGESAWRASGLSALRRDLNVKLIQTVGLDRLADDAQAKARLWKQLQAHL